MSRIDLASYLEGFDEPRMLMNKEYRIVAANQAYRDQFAGGKAVTGRRCYEVSHQIGVPCDQAGESCPLKDSQASGRKQRVLHLHQTHRGEEHVVVEVAPIRDIDGEATLFLESIQVVRQASSRPAAQGLVGRSPPFQKMLDRVMRVAPSLAAVLLRGETGTGKELVARAIHEASLRADGPFVVVDCSGLTETLFESELFGYEKGAFTGANHRKAGLVEAAQGGTLFLDEIGELPLFLQVKLLRLLETGTYRRVGGIDALPANFRLVSATHRDLHAMVRQGSFRQDLYYRINTFPIHTPALHERPGDLPLLCESLLARVAPQRKLRLSVAALKTLETLPLEGNIRELRNLLERASLLSDKDEIEPIHLLDDAPEYTQPTAPQRESAQPAWVSLEDNENNYLLWALRHHEGDRQSLARKLGISERTLFRKLRSLNPGELRGLFSGQPEPADESEPS